MLINQHKMNCREWDGVLTKVIDYCRYYRYSIPQEIITPWDASFVELDTEMLMEMKDAAEYLQIESLYELVCAKLNEAKYAKR